MEILYWISRIDAINGVLLGAIIFSSIVILVQLFDGGTSPVIVNFCVVIAIVSIILFVLIPTKEDLIIMYKINPILENLSPEDSIQFKVWLEK